VGATAATAPTKEKRLPALDTLRACAIVWVILHHLRGAFALPLTNPLLVNFLKHGNAGVDLFFVLSGYLIARILLGELRATRSLHVGRFWYRRWMRTLPAYYAVLLFLAGSDFLLASGTVWHGFPAYLVFLQNYTNNEETLRFVWSWSLCVEEWFYLLLPPVALGLVRLLRRLSPEMVLRLIAGAALLTSVASRAWLFHKLHAGAVSPGQFIWTIDLVSHYRLDGIAAGVLLATLPKPRAGIGLLLAVTVALGVLAAVIFTEESDALRSQRVAILAACFAIMVYASLGGNAWSRLRVPGAAFIADISYSLYLMHPIAEKTVLRFCPGQCVAVQVVLFLALTLIASVALRYAVERPFLRLRERSRNASSHFLPSSLSGSLRKRD
jgi:peptidoglycan/LPS O-acetylase OafA/YrhL